MGFVKCARLRMGWIPCILLCLCWGCTRTVEEPRYLQDHAHLLSASRQKRIIAIFQRLQADIDVHFMTVILAESPDNLAEKAVSVFHRYAIGKDTNGAKGLLFLVDPVGQAVRLEVGYDLEGIFTDVFVGYIERAQMKPFFEAGRVADGIEATCELLVSKAMNAIAGEPLGDKANGVSDTHLSGGGGAAIKVGIHSGAPEKSPAASRAEFRAQDAPLMTLTLYMTVLKRHIKDPELEIYTPATREFLNKWLVTDAQQNNELNDLARVFSEAVVRIAGDLAVVRFPISDRQTAPYFFRLANDGGWQLDFAASNRLVGFNHKNQWFFRRVPHEFDFAFNDLSFDRNGFPHEKK